MGPPHLATLWADPYPTPRAGGDDSTNDNIQRLQAVVGDRYAIEREIGRGGMSIVYLARDLRHGREVAVKVLRPELTASVGPDRFLREIKIAARLQHPHILPLYDSGEGHELLYYVMPFVAGESLRDRLAKQGPLAIAEALEISREVGAALAYAHDQGIVHRDIKPENILLSSGLAMVADFGIASALVEAGVEPITNSGVAIGTPGYMSPEQAGGASRLDGRSDVYSLGCVLFEMLAGEPPFTGPTPQAVLARHIHERPPSLHIVRPTIPPTVEQAINRALAKVPADRFATATEFVAALAAPAPIPGPPASWRRVALRVVIALVIAAGGWMGWQRWGLRSGQLPSPLLDPTRMAVLYFTDRSPNGSLRHIAHGLTEDLIDKLGSVQGLHLVPPSGVRPYSGKDIPLDSIARALQVGTLVEGSVERPGARLRVRVRLIDASTNQQLESVMIERPLGDLFALQDELADSVSRALRLRLGHEVRLREQQAATRSVAAWELLRQADALIEDAARLEAADNLPAVSRMLDQADTLLGRAERLDPLWNDPTIARGWLMVRQAELRGPDSAAVWIRKGLEHTGRALRRDPHDARAAELRGTLRFSLWELPAGTTTEKRVLIQNAEADLRAAVSANPGLAHAWNSLSMIYQQLGDWRQADVTLRRAIQADAYLTETARSMPVLMFASLERGDTAAARGWCETGRAQFPNDFHLWECELTLLGWLATRPTDAARAWTLVRTIERRDSLRVLAMGWGVRRLMVAAILARAGLADSARHVMRATRTTASSQVLETLGLYEGFVFTELHDDAAALRALEGYVQTFPHAREYVATTRWFAPLHGEPRFITLSGLGPDSAAQRERAKP